MRRPEIFRSPSMREDNNVTSGVDQVIKYIVRLLLTLGLSAAFLLQGCGAPTSQELMAAAKQQIAKKEYRSAIVSLKGALQMNERDPDARYLMGTTLMEQGDATAAATELGKAVEYGFDANLGVPAVARALVRSGQARKLIALHGATTLSQATAMADLLTSLTLAFSEERDRERAAQSLSAALDADPKFVPARMLKARAVGATGKFDDALAIMAEVLVAEPGLAKAWQLRGELLLLARKDEPAASSAFSKALAIDPGHVPAHIALTTMALRQRNFELASSRLAKMKRRFPAHTQTTYFESQLAFAEGKMGVAREKVQQLLRAAPDDVRLLHLAASIEFQSGALLVAESHLTKALSISPGNAPVRLLLAHTYLRSGEAAKSLAMVAPLLEVPEPSAEALGLAAEGFLQSGNAREASTHFARASKANPDDGRYRTALALTKVARGEVKSGLADLELVAASDNSAFADLALVSARLASGDQLGALKAIEGVERKQPKNPVSAMTRGHVLQTQKDLVGARKSYERALELDRGYLPALVRLGDLDLVENKPDAAIKRFESLLQLDASNYRARLALAETKRVSGQKPEAVRQVIEEAVRLSPGEVAPRLALITHLLGARQSKEAVSAAQSADAAISGNVEITDALGRAQLASGERQPALASFRKVASALPRNPMPLVRLAEAHAMVGDLPAAMQVLRQALQLAPNLLSAQQQLIEVAIVSKQWSEALAVARTVQKQRPTSAEGYLWEGSVLASQKRWDAAIAAYQTAWRLGKTTHRFIQLHAALSSAKRGPEADRLADAWLSEHPDDAQLNMYLGDTANARGNYDIAAKRYLAVLDRQKDNALAMNNVAWVMIKLANSDALPYAERANKLVPENPAFLDTWALALAAANQPEKALSTQKRAVAIAPELNVLRLNLARIAIQAGDKSLAKSELERLAYLGEKFAGQTQVAVLIKSLQ